MTKAGRGERAGNVVLTPATEGHVRALDGAATLTHLLDAAFEVPRREG